ncbi:MAG: DUF4349 domain-containing protein [Deltaproteobacteria bacterium]|nr:DUF4349 domain-containing protein [Deltaproteobacteria bacterium]
MPDVRLRWLLIALVTACAAAPPSRPMAQDTVSLLEQRRRLDEPMAMAQVASVVVRHRRIVTGSIASKVGGLFGGGGSPGPAVAQVLTSPGAPEPEKLVIEAWLEVQVDDVAGAAAAVRARVEADGGRVVSENVVGAASAASSAAMQLRIPPARQGDFLGWLAGRGTVESKRILATDVGKQLFDQELALKNLELTMARLHKLAERDVPMKEMLELENEMTRVRGQIESLRGEQRWLLDRVAFTTITLTLRREGGPVDFAPHARIHPGAHVAMLTLLDPSGRPRTRAGGGATIHVQRYLTLDLDVFPAKDGDSRAVLATLGSALYSGLLGGGHRRVLNPYLGLRGGYGYLSGEACGVLGAEVGVELYKHKLVQLGVSTRAMAFFRGDRTDVALHTLAGFEIAF